jgi:DNA-binding NtrC family response regulator
MVSLPPGIVLVVDDDAAVRVALQRLLVRAGMNVVTATDTREALAATRRHRHDLSVIIVDLGLGREDGAALVRHLRRRRPTLGIVIFSGNAEGTMRQDLLTLGVRDYIVKPAPLPRIVDAVRRAIDPAPEAYPRESAL